MSITIYDPPPPAADELRRERAVEVSGALDARDDAVLCRIVAEARRRLHTATAAVSIVHGDYQHLIAASGMPTGIYSRRTSLCGHAVAAGGSMFQVPDTASDRRFMGNPWVNGEEGLIGFYAATLLRDSDCHALGTFCVTDLKARAPLDDGESRDLQQFAAQVRRRLDDLRSMADMPAGAAQSSRIASAASASASTSSASSA